MRKYGWFLSVLCAAVVVGACAGGAFADAGSNFTGSKGVYTFDFVSADTSADLQAKYDKWVANVTGATELTVTGDLDKERPWAIIAHFLGNRCAPNPALSFTAKSVPADIVNLSKRPFDGNNTATWGSCWDALQKQGVRIDATLKNVSPTASSADQLVRVFADKAIALEKIALTNGTALKIPPSLHVKELKVDKDSKADFRGFTHENDFVAFAGRTTFSAADGATFIVPDGTTKEDLGGILRLLFGGKEKVPALKAETPNGTKWSVEEVRDAVRHKSGGGGCDAGFGLGGLFLLAGAVLTGRKQG